MRMTAEERQRYERDGFLVRTGVFSSAELDDLRSRGRGRGGHGEGAGHAETGPGPRHGWPTAIASSSRAAPRSSGSGREGSEAIRLIEPVAHLDPRLAALFADDRLIQPMHDALNIDDVGPFTSKLNLKRAEEGSEFPYHQDYPYWYVVVEEHAADIATAIVFLDDARAGNGACACCPDRIDTARLRAIPATRPGSSPTPPASIARARSRWRFPRARCCCSGRCSSTGRRPTRAAPTGGRSCSRSNPPAAHSSRSARSGPSWWSNCRNFDILIV